MENVWNKLLDDKAITLLQYILEDHTELLHEALIQVHLKAGLCHNYARFLQ